MVALKFVIICLSVLGDIEQTLLLSLGTHFRFEFPLMFVLKWWPGETNKGV